jgi:hypothetical protein
MVAGSTSAAGTWLAGVVLSFMRRKKETKVFSSSSLLSVAKGYLGHDGLCWAGAVGLGVGLCWWAAQPGKFQVGFLLFSFSSLFSVLYSYLLNSNLNSILF